MINEDLTGFKEIPFNLLFRLNLAKLRQSLKQLEVNVTLIKKICLVMNFSIHWLNP